MIALSTLVFASVAFGHVTHKAHTHEEEDYMFEFLQWYKQHEKSYTRDEFSQRYSVFKTNLDFIQEHNAKNSSVKVALNAFADMKVDEFHAVMKGYNHYERPFIRSKNENHFLGALQLPREVDWTKKNAVTPPKNQGQCGSCWSFSTTGAIEGAHAIATGKLVSLSESQLVDCAGSYGNMGCNGGLMDHAFEYVQANGLCTEADYPYSPVAGKCKKCKTAVKLHGYTDVRPNDEDALMQAVAKGPVSVAIEADKQVFQFYSSGVMSSTECGTQLDHGVLVVGYGELNGNKYWKVKNSWGPTWGLGGFILLGRGGSGNAAGVCGILSAPSYPLV